MGRTKELLDQEWYNLSRDMILDAEYQEYLEFNKPKQRDND